MHYFLGHVLFANDDVCEVCKKNEALCVDTDDDGQTDACSCGDERSGEQCEVLHGKHIFAYNLFLKFRIYISIQ